MTIKEFRSFKTAIDGLISLMEISEKKVTSKSKNTSEIAMKTVEFLQPRIKDITVFYIRKLLEEPAIGSNNAFLASLRIDVIEKVRKHCSVKLSRKHATMLRTSLK